MTVISAPRVRFSLGEHSRIYSPGERLEGLFTLEGTGPRDVRAVELSVLWHTEGKGDEDMSVHFFERIETTTADALELRQPRHFSTQLPNSPLSYSGMILRICWCARARVFLPGGKEVTKEIPFQLGTVPSARELVAS
jgi:hypothetical protein